MVAGREQLVENYEDALFALLIEDVIEAEGQRLLEENRRLKQDPGAAVPGEVDRRCIRTIRRAQGKERRQTMGRSAYRVFSKAAVAAVLCATLFMAACAASPELRSGTLNLLIEVSDAYTSLTMINREPAKEGGSAAAGDLVLQGYRIPQVPEGFELDEELSGSDRKSAWLYYTDGNGGTIYFDIFRTAGGSLQEDTEGAQNVETIWVHGYEGLLIEKDGRVDVIWGDTDQSAFCSVMCIGMDRDLALELANGVVFVGEEE